MYRMIGFMALLETFGLLGFIIISPYQEGMIARYLPLWLAIAVVVLVAYIYAKFFSYKEIVYISVATTVLFVFFVQILELTLYPGLNKGIELFSKDNLFRGMIMLFVGIAGHFILLFFMRMGRLLFESQ